MEIKWPKKAREIQNPIMDSERWSAFTYRDGDIVIATVAKAGTTWMQQIVGQLIFGGEDCYIAPSGYRASPWIEMRLLPLDALVAQIEAQKHRRFVKTHLAIDALPFSPNAKYIYVGRDARDIIWSVHNMLTSLSQEMRDDVNAQSGLDTKVVPPRPDLRAYYLDFINNRGDAGRDHWQLWEHVQGWWNYRHLPNVLLVHFNNLKADLPGEVRRIARFLDIALDEAVLPQIVAHCHIDYMREKAGKVPQLNAAFNGGVDSFFYKGTNGRWKDVLSTDEIVLCDKVAAQNLTPDCAHWLKTGELPT